MKKISLLFAAILAYGIVFSQNINLSNSPYWDGECYLAANPQNPKHIVAAWMYFSTSNLKNSMATRTSFDGGKTWSPLQQQPHVYSKFTSADPTMYFGKDSSVYLAFIDLSGLKTSDSGYIMVTHSVNGGITWNTPVKAIGWKDAPNLPIDRPWIAADGTNGPYSGRVYLTSQNAYFAPFPHHPWFTYSTNNGATWAPIKQLDDSIPSGVMTDATTFTTVAANGALYGVYYSYYTAYSPYARLIEVKSFNGGSSFTTHSILNLTTADVIPTADSLLKAGLSISSNPADTSNLILLSPSNYFGEPDVVSYNTLDAGNTWNGPVRVNDDVKGAYDTCHDLVWGDFTASGKFAAAWRDRRNTGKGDSASFQIYGSVSTTQGNSYGTNFRISDTISPPVFIERGDDFLGCAASDSSVYALWSDMRTGKENTFFNATPLNKIVTAVPAISDNPAIKVDVYPNPFHNQTHIVIHSVERLTNGTLLVFSMAGQKVAEMPIGEGTIHNIDVGSLAAGAYTWSLMEKGKILAQGKWIIN